MTNLATARDEIKAILAGAGDTPTAKLIAILDAAGICNTAEVAALVGLKVRAIQTARRRNGATQCAGATECAQQNAQAQPIAPENATHCAEAQPIAPRARVEGYNNPSYLEDRLVNNNPPFPLIADATSAEDRAALIGSAIVLRDDLRQYWIARLGSAERLELALIQVAQYVQPNSRRSLEVQVSSQLAKLAGDKRDRDERYAKASAERSAPPKSKVLELLAAGLA